LFPNQRRPKKKKKVRHRGEGKETAAGGQNFRFRNIREGEGTRPCVFQRGLSTNEKAVRANFAKAGPLKSGGGRTIIGWNMRPIFAYTRHLKEKKETSDFYVWERGGRSSIQNASKKKEFCASRRLAKGTAKTAPTEKEKGKGERDSRSSRKGEARADVTRIEGKMIASGKRKGLFQGEGGKKRRQHNCGRKRDGLH